jgi:uncharacterized membrane protein
MSTTRAERSLGLIDGVYAVAVTLVAIDVPKTVFPYLRSGDWFSIEPIAFLLVYVCQFLIMYDVWMIHKNISMKNEEKFSKISELISMILLGIVILSPGIIEDTFEIMKENSDNLQSTDMNYSKIFIYFYLVLIYALLVLLEISIKKKILIKPFLFNGLIARVILFLSFFVLGLFTFHVGWVMPVPIVIILMVILKMFL